MTDEDLIGYLLDLTDPAERAGVEAAVADRPEVAARLDRLRAALAPLDADKDEIDPPAGLAMRTVARMATHIVEHVPAGRRSGSAVRPVAAAADRPDYRAVGGRFRADWAVACGIGLVAVGLGLSAVGKARHRAAVLGCQNNLLALHRGLAGYADTHAGKLPEVGDEPYPTAGSFVLALHDAGQVPPDFRPVCPADPRPPVTRTAPVSYAYPLGYRTPAGEVVGRRRSADGHGDSDLLPVSADYPIPAAAPGGGPTSAHPAGQNVLFLGGHVKFTASPAVGLFGDDIYRNHLGAVAAGVDRTDTVLGRCDDRP